MLRLGQRLWWIEVLLEKRDCWIGVYWTWKAARYGSAQGMVTRELHIYICLIPCCPIHIIRGYALAAS
jgi:hypothetical protein